MAPVLDGAAKEEKPDHRDWDRLIRPILCKLAHQSTRAYMQYTYSMRCMQYDRKHSKSKAMGVTSNKRGHVSVYISILTDRVLKNSATVASVQTIK